MRLFVCDKYQTVTDKISKKTIKYLEAFAATEFSEIFSDWQPRQDMEVFRRFGN